QFGGLVPRALPSATMARAFQAHSHLSPERFRCVRCVPELSGSQAGEGQAEGLSHHSRGQRPRNAKPREAIRPERAIQTVNPTNSARRIRRSTSGEYVATAALFSQAIELAVFDSGNNH